MVTRSAGLVAFLGACVAVAALTFAQAPDAASQPASAAGIVPADNPPNWVPLGAYLSWERLLYLARYNKVEYWTDICKRLDVLKENGVDTLWATNMQDEHFPRLIKECEKRDLKLLVSMGAMEIKIKDRWLNNGAYYDTALPYLVKRAGNSKALIGWVLSDEPQEEDFPNAEIVRKRLRELDPQRFCLMVTMRPQAPSVPALTQLPVVCVDLYPFFGPNDPNGPHTPATSIAFYRGNIQGLVDAIGTKNAVAWIMGQCFTEIRGQRKFDKQDRNLIALPGSYLHWVCPTLPQMRWQVWEAIRGGAKGVIIYTTAPETPDPETEFHKEPGWTQLLDKPVDPGPNALTYPDASATPQLVELGKTYRLIGPHKALIQRWKRADTSDIEIASPAMGQRFLDPQTGKAYLVVVNDDFENEHSIAIRAKSSMLKLSDIIHASEAKVTEGSGATIALPAGSGTILEIR